ncbi:MAG TPA: phosphoribosylanthranilate isomerase [Bacteroidota bacterium]|nr:phosphoribosylanthranilate isomerase [Bacteroidota bacterium]
MNTRVKICGITNAEDAQICSEAGADALGFIFYSKSPRFITLEAARMIIASLPPFITPVGVFVNENRDTINRTIAETRIGAIQLSGDERPEDCLGFSVPVIKAFRLTTGGDVTGLADYPIAAALLDGAKDDKYGGTGERADVALASRLAKRYRLILAGGLDPSNIVEAIRIVQPYAVDVNSGVELSPGKKDYAKISLLFERLRKFSGAEMKG